MCQRERRRGIAELLQQNCAWGCALQQQRVGQLRGEALVRGAHLGVAGEQAEGAAVGDLQHAASAFRGLEEVFRIARVGHSRRQIEQRLSRKVEVRGDNQLARQGKAEPP